MNPEMKRAGIFVDVQNVYGSTKSISGKTGIHYRINYSRLREHFNQTYDVHKAIAFTCYDPINTEQVGFITAISSCGWRVVAKPAKKSEDGIIIKANCDLEMALEILRTANTLDVVILATNDSDFASLIHELSMMGRRVIIIGSRLGICAELLRACDEIVRFEDMNGVLERQVERVVDRAAERVPEPISAT